MFRRKHEFKPDRTGNRLLSKLYLTRKQRRSLLKWTLYALCLLALSLLQDVILPGLPIDPVGCGILLTGLLLQPDDCGIFCLVSAVLFYFSGSAPGPYAIALLTCLPLFLNIFRHSYLRKTFGSTLLCAGVALMLYELAVFSIGTFLGSTIPARFETFLMTGLCSLALMPPLYPILVSIGKIGGDSWKD